MVFRTTVSARVLKIGDVIDGETVTNVNTESVPGTVYVWTTPGGGTISRGPRANHIFNHGDPVRVTRFSKET